MISFAVTAKLICVFVFAYAKCWFSHNSAHIYFCSVIEQRKVLMCLRVCVIDPRFCCSHTRKVDFLKMQSIGSGVEHPLREREVVGSNPGRAIPKALKWHKWLPCLVLSIKMEITGFSSPNKQCNTYKNVRKRTVR